MNQIILLLLLVSNLSFAEIKEKRVGLLTDDYGIVTKEDLDEEEKKATPLPFSPESISFQYWQCLKPDSYYLHCSNTGKMLGEGWDIGSAEYWVKSDGKKYNFGTRRNWSIDFCKEMVTTIQRIMKNESVVCISALYLDEDKEGSNWIIDRVKTKKGEWS